ncbi:helix-turn-helix transcriptional regulator [Dyadobacter jiangsuensis]
MNGIFAMISCEFPEEKFGLYRSISHLQSELSEDVPKLVLIGLKNADDTVGSTLLAIAKLIFPVSPIVCYGNERNLDIIREYYKIGIMGYFLLSNDSLVKCVRSVVEGRYYFCSELVDFFIESLHLQNICADDRRLTRRQYQVAYLLAREVDINSMSKSLGIQVHTIRLYKARIFQRLGVKNVSELKSMLSLL